MTITINKKYMKYIILLAPLLLSLTSYAIFVDSFSSVLLVAKIIVFLTLAFEVVSKKRISKFDIATIVYTVIYLVSVFLNGEDPVNGLKEITMVFSYVMIIKTGFEGGKNNKEAFFKAFSDLFTVLLIVNAVLLIFYPKGLFGSYVMGEDVIGVDLIKTRYNFLGLDNATTPIIIVALAVWTITHSISKRKKIFFILEALGLAGNILQLKSATLIVAVVMIVLLLILEQKKILQLDMKKIAIVVSVLFVVLVILGETEIFSVIIVDILDKGASMTSRSHIWSEAIKFILEKPVLGHGIGNFAYVYEDRNAHNMYLQIVAQTGFVGMGILTVIMSMTGKVSDKNKIRMMKICLLVFLICCLNEVYYIYWLFILFGLLYYSGIYLNTDSGFLTERKGR